MGWRTGGLAAALFVLGACGESPPAPPDAGFELDAVDVGTVAPETVFAGQPLAISCVLIDVSGEMLAPPAGLDQRLRFVPEDSVELLEDGSWIATRTGQVEVSCVFSELRLADASPAIIEVTPGEPAVVTTALDLDSIEAGEFADVMCETFDAFGNRIEDAAPTARSEPADDGNTFEGYKVASSARASSPSTASFPAPKVGGRRSRFDRVYPPTL